MCFTSDQIWYSRVICTSALKLKLYACLCVAFKLTNTSSYLIFNTPSTICISSMFERMNYRDCCGSSTISCVDQWDMTTLFRNNQNNTNEAFEYVSHSIAASLSLTIEGGVTVTWSTSAAGNQTTSTLFAFMRLTDTFIQHILRKRNKSNLFKSQQYL